MRGTIIERHALWNKSGTKTCQARNHRNGGFWVWRAGVQFIALTFFLVDLGFGYRACRLSGPMAWSDI
jgi:hypothetical protein